MKYQVSIAHACVFILKNGAPDHGGLDPRKGSIKAQ